MVNDLLLDADHDLQIENGDLVFGPSDLQHIEHLLILSKGEIKASPLGGVGLPNKLKSTLTPSELRKSENEIREQLKADGAKEIVVSWDEGVLKVNSRYE